LQVGQARPVSLRQGGAILKNLLEEEVRTERGKKQHKALDVFV